MLQGYAAIAKKHCVNFRNLNG